MNQDLLEVAKRMVLAVRELKINRWVQLVLSFVLGMVAAAIEMSLRQ